MSCETKESSTALAGLPPLVSGVDVSAFEEPELAMVLSEVRLLQRCLDGLVMRIGIRADELAGAGRCAPAPETMRARGAVGSRQARRECDRARTAAAIGHVAAAASAGEISGDHVDAITRHTSDLTDQQRAAIDVAGLVERAKELPVETFDRLVKRRVTQVIGDGGLGDAEAKRSASEFRHWFDHASGMGRFAGSLDPERYETLINAVDSHAASIAAASDGTITRSRNLSARALVELIVGSGGSDTRNRVPSITVIVDHQTILNGPHDGSITQTACGHDLTAATVARLCCDAVLRRVTLDDRGVPIDVGRNHRTATDGQWAAIKAIHSTCAWEDCSAPISWCQAHHITEWERGGHTDLHNLIPLCSQHHHLVHEGRWHIELLPDRSLQIHKPNGTHHNTIPPPRRC